MAVKLSSAECRALEILQTGRVAGLSWQTFRGPYGAVVNAQIAKRLIEKRLARLTLGGVEATEAGKRALSTGHHYCSGFVTTVETDP